MDDTQRLDAISEYGLCLATHDTRTINGWNRLWVVSYDVDKTAMAPTIREAIDAAVLDLSARGLTRN